MNSLSFFAPTKQGVFLRRPNRFVAECLLEGKTVRAHMPNPGRMRELLFPGVTMWLAEGNEAKRTTAYSVVAVERDNQPVVLETLASNRIARELLTRRAVPGWEDWQVAAAEVKEGAHRFDFLLENSKGETMLLEVKSCTLFGETGAMFPDAVTARGSSHVRTLTELATNGRRCGVLFIVHAAQTQWFLPEYHTDPVFAAALAAARPYVDIRAMSISWKPGFILDAAKKLDIPWNVYEQEGADGGVYMAFLEVTADCRLQIGSLGEREFRAGYYVYVGSAARGLEARVARHGRLRKKMHWHFDYLRQAALWKGALPIRTQERLECSLAKAVRELAAGEIAGFGASDCHCGSHLFYFEQEPQKQKSFQAMFQRFRIDRLQRILKK